MKKTLIAMAALAVSGASFAQVTITGTVAMGYQMTTGNGQTSAVTNRDAGMPVPAAPTGFVLRGATGGNDASGLGIDTTEIVFTAKEDMGSGQTIAATMTIDTLNRGGVAGGDTKLTYTNQSFGRIELGTEKGAAVHSGIPSAGAPVINMDGKLFEIRSSSDYISYAVPIGPVALVIKHSESASGIGLGQGMTGTAGGTAPGTVGQRNTTLAALYNSGPLKVLGAYRGYDNQDGTSIASRLGLTKERVYAFAAGYDLGVAQLGFGYNQTTATVGAKVNDMLVGVNVPLGPVTVGATWARSSSSGVTDAFNRRVVGVAPAMTKAEGDADGFSVGAVYELSKRTNISLKHASWTRSGYEQFEAASAAGGGLPALAQFGFTGKYSETNLLLSHSF